MNQFKRSKQIATVCIVSILMLSVIFTSTAYAVSKEEPLFENEKLPTSTTESEQMETESHVSTPTEEGKEQPSSSGTNELLTETSASESLITDTEESIGSEASTESSVDSVTQEDTAQAKAITSGTWGTAPWTFDTATGLLEIGGGELTGYTQSPWHYREAMTMEIKKIVLTESVKAPTNSNYLFSHFMNMSSYQGLPKLTQIEGIENLDTSGVTNMEQMFEYDKSLTSLDLSSFDTSNVTAVSGMFKDNWMLNSLDLSSFELKKVTVMASMFFNCKSLSVIDISKFDMRNPNLNKQSIFNKVPLSKLILGANNRLGYTNLGAPKSDNPTATGKWIREDGNSAAYTPEDFMTQYGTGDLTAGTYVAETARKAVLSSQVSFEKPTETVSIGEQVKGTLTIEHDSTSDVGSKASNVKVEVASFLNDVLEGLPTISLEEYDREGTLISTTPLTIENGQVSLPDLTYGYVHKLVLSGTAWNNTTLNTQNYLFKTIYKNGVDASEEVVETTGYYGVANGTLAFAEVPQTLMFKDTALVSNLNGSVIDREDDDFKIKINDTRGTNPITSGDPAVSRNNWEITATAQSFKIGEETLPQGVLGMVYLKDGSVSELSETDETVIESHNVTGETPKNNATHELNWTSEDGLKIKVYNRNALSQDRQYTGQVDFELRQAP